MKTAFFVVPHEKCICLFQPRSRYQATTLACIHFEFKKKTVSLNLINFPNIERKVENIAFLLSVNYCEKIVDFSIHFGFALFSSLICYFHVLSPSLRFVFCPFIFLNLVAFYFLSYWVFSEFRTLLSLCFSRIFRLFACLFVSLIVKCPQNLQIKYQILSFNGKLSRKTFLPLWMIHWIVE